MSSIYVCAITCSGHQMALGALINSLLVLILCLAASERDFGRPFERRADRDASEPATAPTELDYQRIFQAAGVALIIHDAQTCAILETNAKADEMFGHCSESRHEEIEAILRTSEGYRTRLEKAVNGQPQLFEWIAEDGTGRILTTEVSLRTANLGGRTIILAEICDVADRRKAEEALKKSESHYRYLAENISDVIFTIDLSFGVTHVSPSVEKLRGYTVEEALSQSPDDVLTPESLKRAQAALAEALSEASRGELPQPRTLEIEIRHKNGSTLWAEMRATLLYDENGKPNGILGTYRDISQRKAAEDALRTRLAYEMMLAKVSREAVTTEDIDTFQENCIKIMGQTLGVSRAYVFQRDESSQGFRMAHEWTAPDVKCRKDLCLSPTDIPYCSDLLHKGRMVCVSSIDSIASETDRETLRRLGVRSLLSFPLFIRDEYHGSIGFSEIRNEREWASEDIELIRTTAHIIRDVLERKQTQAARRMYISAIDGASDQIVIADPKGRVEYVNPAFERDTGFRQDEVIGTYPHLTKGAADPGGLRAILGETANAGDSWHGEISVRRRDGSSCTEDVTIAPVKDKTGNVEHFIAIKRNITEKKNYERQLDNLAHHDHLTGLPNRLALGDRLNQELSRAERENSMLGVMFLDLDRFKLINDTLGHNVGDLLLRQVSARLAGRLRDMDSISRMGGDEFIVLLPDIGRIDDIVEVAQRLIDAFSKPFVLAHKEFFVTTSIGISVYPNDGASVDTLVRHADTAMYQAKEEGRNSYRLFTQSLNTANCKRVEMEQNLRKALERNEFTVHYQPRVDIRNDLIVGAEALVRWQHPEMGLVLPGQFIPLAEETGLIMPLSDVVLRATCIQNARWQQSGFAPMDIAVNISARQFQQGDLVEAIRKTLMEAGLPPERLRLELTESTLMQDPELAASVMRDLKQLGVMLSIDDFGTGYSSLNYLKRFPVDSVKIDQSFISGITTNPDDAAIAGAVIAMAHSLKLTVTAEGVETLEQLKFLRSLNCDEIQGYLISRPVAADAFTQLLLDQERLQELPLSA